MRILYFTFFVFLWSLPGKSRAQTPYSDVDQNDLLRKNNITKMLLFKSYVPDGIVKDSILKESVHYKYKDGHFSEQEYFDEKNQLRFRYNFLYNEKHQLILLISELGGPVHPAASFIEPIKLYQFDYDSLGREIRSYEYNKDTTSLNLRPNITITQVG